MYYLKYVYIFISCVAWKWPHLV